MKPLVQEWSRRRRLVVTWVVVTLVVGVTTGFAVKADGYSATKVDLSDASVWVTSAADGTVGRINTQIGALNSSVAAPSADFDVVQEGDRVLVVDSDLGEVRPVDVGTVQFGAKWSVGKEASVGLGGGVGSVLQPDSGKWWAGPIDGMSGLDTSVTPPLLTVTKGAVSTVSLSGKAFAVAPGSDKLWSIGFDDTGKPAGFTVDKAGKPVPPTPATLPGGALTASGPGAPEPVAVSAVGDEPAVLDRPAGVVVIGGQRVTVPGAASAQIQQPGPASPEVMVATGGALLAVPTGGGAPRTVWSGGSGSVAAPVVVAGCIHAAWAGTAGTGTYVRVCGDGPVQTKSFPVPDQSRLVFRVNGNAVALNDARSGKSFLVAADMSLTIVDNWAEVKPKTDNPDTDPNADAQNDTTVATAKTADCVKQDPIQPKVPTMSFSVRAGRTVVLPVLDNVTSGDCTALRLDLPKNPDKSVSVVNHGQALQVAVPASASGALTPITFLVGNGVGKPVTGTAKVTVVPADQPGTIKQAKKPATSVEAGGSVTYNVVRDYVSNVGDDLYLDSVSSTTDDQVTFAPDGAITFRSVGNSGPGRKTVAFVVGDGHSTQRGELTVTVLADGEGKPTAAAAFADSVEGVPVTAYPARSVVSPSAKPVSVTKVTPKGSAPKVTVNQDGSVNLPGTKAGTYLYSYDVEAGGKKSTGVLRYDVAAKPDKPIPVAVTDVVYLPAGDTVRVDPTANDADPGGQGLAVAQVGSVPPNTLSVTTDRMQTLQIAARGRLSKTVTFDYVVSNGAGQSTGQVRVVPVPALSDPPPPQALQVSTTVRAGDAVTIPISRLGVDPRGEALTVKLLNPEAVTDGILFQTDTSIRFLAPKTPPDSAVRFTFIVSNTSGQQSTPGRVTLTVRDGDLSHNSAPTTPPTVVARVFTGDTTTVPLPLECCVDPDGDMVSVADPQAQSGTVSVTGQSTLSYRASATPGVDTVSYSVVDTSGAKSTGSVRMIVVDKPDTLEQPVAPDLAVSVRPGKKVAVRALEAAGRDDQRYADPAVSGVPAGWKVTVDGDALVVNPGQAPEGTSEFTYTVTNEQKLTASGKVRVTVSKAAPLVPPTAADVTVTAAMFHEDGTAQVDVTSLIANNAGAVAELKVALGAGQPGTVAGPRVLSVPVTDVRQVIAYTVTDGNASTSTALIVVPRRKLLDPKLADQKPVAKPTVKTLEVKAGQTVTGRIADYVTVPLGQKAVVGDIGPAKQGKGAKVDDDTFSYTADVNAPGGPDTLTVTAVNGSQSAKAQVPIKVTPAVPKVKDYDGLQVEPGGTVSFDLTKLLDPQGSDASHLVFSTTGGAEGISGSVGGTTLTVRADATARKGAQASLTVTVAAQGVTKTGTVTVTVVGTSKAPPTIGSHTLEGRKGQQVSVDVLAGATDPFGKGLTLVGAEVISGEGSVSKGGSSVVVTPTAVGTLKVDVTVADATKDPDRYAHGTIEITVKDKPSKPAGVQGSEADATSVNLSWSPSDDNGAPITSYVVSGTGGVRKDCGTQTTCTITGLTPGTSYTFTVEATNEVGPSGPSTPSAPIKPDAVPTTPGAPTAAWKARGEIDVSWKIPTGQFSKVSDVKLHVSGGQVMDVGTATSKTVTGLDQGNDYTFTVEVINERGTSGESAPSTPVRPSGVPQTAPGNVAVAFVYSSGERKAVVTWDAPSDTGGEPIDNYIVSLDGNQVGKPGGGTSALDVPNPSDGSHSVTVQGINKRGSGPVSNAGSFTAFTKPGAPGSVTAEATGADGTVTLTWGPGQEHSNSIGRYDYQIDGGGWNQAGGSSSTTINGLTNGTIYSFAVRACYTEPSGYDETVMCSDPSVVNEKAKVAPYGPLRDMAVQAQVQGDRVLFTWSPQQAANGRSIVSASYAISSGGSGDGMPGNAASSPAYYTDSTITVTVKDAAGQTRQFSTNGATGTNPNRWVDFSFEGTYGAGVTDYCTSAGCHHIVIRGGGFRPNSTLTISYSTDCNTGDAATHASCAGGVNGGYENYKVVSIAIRSDGTPDPDGRYFGFHGASVWLDLDGVRSPAHVCP